MKKIIAIVAIGMFMLVGLGNAVMGEPEDPVVPNGAPGAPIINEDKSGLEKETYKCSFYSIDPDGDKVYYAVHWKKIDSEVSTLCEPDDPSVPWLGPFDSGEEIDDTRKCKESGEYELSIYAKDIYGHIGPTTTKIVNYKKAKVLELPVFARILQRFPGLVHILMKILKI